MWKKGRKKGGELRIRRNARRSQRLSFQKISFGRKQRRKPTEGCEQGGVQKVECKRHIQKGKCREAAHNGRKHARWPAATCGYLKRKRAFRRALGKIYRRAASFCCFLVRRFVILSFRRSLCRGVVVLPMGCTTSRRRNLLKPIKNQFKIYQNPSQICQKSIPNP